MADLSVELVISMSVSNSCIKNQSMVFLLFPRLVLGSMGTWIKKKKNPTLACKEFALKGKTLC